MFMVMESSKSSKSSKLDGCVRSTKDFLNKRLKEGEEKEIDLKKLKNEKILPTWENGKGKSKKMSKSDFGNALAFLRDHESRDWEIKRLKKDHWIVKLKPSLDWIIPKLEKSNVDRFKVKEDHIVVEVMADKYKVFADGKIEGNGIGRTFLEKVIAQKS
jgi:hypothetical protein